MKNSIFILTLFLATNLLGQHKITSASELREFNKRKQMNDVLKSNFNGDNYVDSVLILLNEYRVENGVKPLVLTENLSKVAKLQSQYCADNLIATHDQEDESLSDPYLRGLKFNERDVMGEVVAECSIDMLSIKNKTVSSSPVENLKTSSGHSQIMRDGKYVRCGISLVQSKKDSNRYYAVIVFSVN
jgi:uncharacterized protein YkwD